MYANAGSTGPTVWLPYSEFIATNGISPAMIKDDVGDGIVLFCHYYNDTSYYSYCSLATTNLRVKIIGMK